MQIPENLLAKWRLLRSHGDNKTIAALNENIIEKDVSRAFKLGRCSDQVFQAVSTFYRSKEKMVKAYLK